MKRYPSFRSLICLTFILFVFNSCSIKLVSSYDEVIDNGLAEYKEMLNVFVKDMIDLGGTLDGTYEENRTKYNKLETKLDILIDRASLNSTGGCKLVAKVTKQLTAQMKDKMPEMLKTANQEEDGNAYGCTEKLLRLIKDQLVLLETIHSTTDKCPDAESKSISCIRKATGPLALNISNQSINAAWIVETAKKTGKIK